MLIYISTSTYPLLSLYLPSTYPLLVSYITPTFLLPYHHAASTIHT